MLDAVFGSFDVAKHHRCAAIQAELVRDFHHLQPLIGIAFQRSDPVSNAINKDLSAPARDRSKPSDTKFQDHFTQRHSENLRKMVKLWWTKRVDIDLRILLSQMVEQIEIVIDPELRMVPSLHQNLNAADSHQFIDLPINVFVA